MPSVRVYILIAVLWVVPSMSAHAQIFGVDTTIIEIGDVESRLMGEWISVGSQFGGAVAGIGDLNDDGNEDVAVGAPGGGPGGEGALWILFMNERGRVDSSAQIDATRLDGLASGDRFGESIAVINKGSPDQPSFLAIGAPGTDSMGDMNEDTGALWMMSIDFSGMPIAPIQINEDAAGFEFELTESEEWGSSIAFIKQDGQSGEVSLLVGAPGSEDTFEDPGNAGILTMTQEGGVINYAHLFGDVSEELGIANGTLLGQSVCVLDPVEEGQSFRVAIGAPLYTDERFGFKGNVFIVSIGEDHTSINEDAEPALVVQPGGEVDLLLSEFSFFGRSVVGLGPLEDGSRGLLIGASLALDNLTLSEIIGNVWFLAVNEDNESFLYLNNRPYFNPGAETATNVVRNEDEFGVSVGALFEADVLTHVMVGASGDEEGFMEGNENRYGAIWFEPLDSLNSKQWVYK